MKKRTRIAKLVTVLCAAIFIFGCTSTVFGANDLVGSATGNGSSATTRTTSTRTTGTGTATRTYTGSGSTSTVSNGAVQGAATTTYTKGAAATADPSTTRVRTAVQTGVADKIMPFALVISAAVLVFWFFFHLQMNQMRYGKSEKYYKELLDFKVMCRE